MNGVMRWFQRGAVKQDEFESQQQKLARLSGEMLSRYRTELKAEISDPDRLAQVYGSEFATSDMKKQCQSVATMATQMLKTPMAMINILNGEEQETVAQVGADDVPPLIATEESFCRHVIGTGREFAVSNSPEHPLVCDTQVSREGIIVSYLGVPIERQGYIVGVLCVADVHPRDWSLADVSILTQLAAVLTRAAHARHLTG
jgi:GAF domain-containing protein